MASSAAEREFRRGACSGQMRSPPKRTAGDFQSMRNETRFAPLPPAQLENLQNFPKLTILCHTDLR
jgi:hypothetical protein